MLQIHREKKRNTSKLTKKKGGVVSGQKKNRAKKLRKGFFKKINRGAILMFVHCL